MIARSPSAVPQPPIDDGSCLCCDNCQVCGGQVPPTLYAWDTLRGVPVGTLTRAPDRRWYGSVTPVMTMGDWMLHNDQVAPARLRDRNGQSEGIQGSFDRGCVYYRPVNGLGPVVHPSYAVEVDCPSACVCDPVLLSADSAGVVPPGVSPPPPNPGDGAYLAHPGYYTRQQLNWGYPITGGPSPLGTPVGEYRGPGTPPVGFRWPPRLSVAVTISNWATRYEQTAEPRAFCPSGFGYVANVTGRTTFTFTGFMTRMTCEGAYLPARMTTPFAGVSYSHHPFYFCTNSGVNPTLAPPAGVFAVCVVSGWPFNVGTLRPGDSINPSGNPARQDPSAVPSLYLASNAYGTPFGGSFGPPFPPQPIESFNFEGIFNMRPNDVPFGGTGVYESISIGYGGGFRFKSLTRFGESGGAGTITVETTITGE